MRSSHRPPLLFLVGFMGAGKSTVGRLLAQRLQWRFVDLDREIERSSGLTIARIFENSGEKEFRKLERSELEHQLGRVSGGAVFALGGGALTEPVNLRSIEQSGGRTVWIDAPVDELWRRCQECVGHVRPLAGDRLGFEQLYQKRNPAYARADHRVLNSGQPAEELVAGLAEWIDRWQQEPSQGGPA